MAPPANPRRPKPGQSFADLHPELAAEWHPTRSGPLTAADVTPSSGLRVWWSCRTCGHEWAAIVANRRRGTGCPRHQHNPMSLAESLAGQTPRLAEQWHPTRNGALTAADVLPGSHRRVWWLCLECGHDWQARILARRHGSGCPACFRRTQWPPPPAGTSLADVFAHVAAEWDFDAKGGLVPEQVYQEQVGLRR